MTAEKLTRCDWGTTDPLMLKYHDEEWGTPVHEDRVHFEFWVLEMFQAGLSWMTVLRKREAFRKDFKNFEPDKVAGFMQKDVTKLLNDPGIIRNRLKIEAAINNAKRFIEIQKEFGSFDKYFWGWVGNKTIVNGWKSVSQIPATSEISDRISADLRQRGWKFAGSTIVYAHMQATGLVNDHTTRCFRYKELTALRTK
jgi:DNA-3-methyladenine glycosylase I